MRLFLTLLFLSILASELRANFIPDSFADLTWQPIFYQDEAHIFSAKLPGNLEDSIQNDQLCFFHSRDRDIHYAIYFNPAPVFHAPESVEELMARYHHLKNTDIVALNPQQENLKYLLQFHMFHEEEGTLQTIIRAYATENALYFAMIQGSDFTLSEAFFQTVEISLKRK